MFGLQRFLIFPAWLLPNTSLPSLPPGAEIWGLDPSPRIHVEAIFLPGWGVGPGAPGPVVAFFHGNGERIDEWVGPLRRYTERGASVLLIEYRGYGRSGGAPSKEALTADSLAFLERLRHDSRVDPDRVVLHGRSIGGGVACAVAGIRPPAALVLQSTFTRMTDLALRRGLPGFLVRDRFDSAEVVARLDVPILIAHGREDPVIPFAQGQALYALARHGRFLALDCEHNNCPPDWGEFMAAAAGFLAESGVLPPSPSP